MLHILTWNVAGRRASVLNALGLHGPFDLVTLQEVRIEDADEFRERLAAVGLTQVHYSGRPRTKKKRYGNMIGSRLPLAILPIACAGRLPWPQLLAQVSVRWNGRDVRIISAHIPNGIANGWDKIDTFRALAKLVQQARRRLCIVTGDFNEPRSSIQDGRIVTFGQDGDSRGCFKCWRKWTFAGRVGTGEEWDTAVRWLFERQPEHGLRLGYWDVHGPATVGVSHVSRGQPRWFDHILVSKHFQVKVCEYLHDLRSPGLSDHSALATGVNLRAV